MLRYKYKIIDKKNIEFEIPEYGPFGIHLKCEGELKETIDMEKCFNELFDDPDLFDVILHGNMEVKHNKRKFYDYILFTTESDVPIIYYPERIEYIFKIIEYYSSPCL